MSVRTEFIPKHVQFIPTFETKRELCFQREIVSSKECESNILDNRVDKFGPGCGRFN